MVGPAGKHQHPPSIHRAQPSTDHSLSLDFHLSRTVQHSAFCVCSFALCSRGLSTLQNACLLPFLLGQYSTVWTLHTLPIHAQSNGTFRSFPASGCPKCNTMHRHILSFLLGKTTAEEFLGHVASHCHFQRYPLVTTPLVTKTVFLPPFDTRV